jgi:hypothetical protein
MECDSPESEEARGVIIRYKLYLHESKKSLYYESLIFIFFRMKKILFSLGIFTSICLAIFYSISTTTATVSDEFADEVFPWMMEHTLTKFTDVDDFRPADSITRAEASKFVVSYAGLIDLDK